MGRLRVPDSGASLKSGSLGQVSHHGEPRINARCEVRHGVVRQVPFVWLETDISVN